MTVQRQWEGDVEFGGFGLRVGGEDLDLTDVLEAGSRVRITVEWPDEQEMHRIMTTFGTLPPRPRAARKEDV